MNKSNRFKELLKEFYKEMSTNVSRFTSRCPSCQSVCNASELDIKGVISQEPLGLCRSCANAVNRPLQFELEVGMVKRAKKGDRL